MKKAIKISVNGRDAVNLEIEGDDDLVQDFLKQAITGSFGAFYKTKELFGDMFINGIKTEMQMVQRDPKGHFVKPELPQQPATTKPRKGE